MKIIVVGMPSYEGLIHTNTVYGLLRDIIEGPGKGFIIMPSFVAGGTYISHTRNDIVRKFLDTDADEMVFIDSDMEWAANDLFRLLSFDADIVGAAYRRKNDNEDDYNMSFLDADSLQADAQGLLEVAGLPTGFLRITRKVFEVMAEKGFGVPYQDHQQNVAIHNFFYQAHIGPDFFGEDFMFCLNARAAGFKILLDPELSIDHVGLKRYKGHVGNWLRQRMEDNRGTRT